MFSERGSAKPGGFLIEGFEVEKKSETEWEISLSPADCGFNLPTIQFNETEEVGNNNNNNSITFRGQGLKSSINVTRIQFATPPISGSFVLSYQNKVSKGMYSLFLVKAFLKVEGGRSASKRGGIIYGVGVCRCQ